MRDSSLPFPADVSEIELLGLETMASERVRPPRIAISPVSFECRFMQEIRLGDFSLVLGEVLYMHVIDEAVIDASRQLIDTSKLDLVGRMESTLYTRTLDKFEPPRPDTELMGKLRKA